MSAKKIAILAFVVSVLGLLSEILNVQYGRVEVEISALISPLSLSFFSADGLYNNINFFNILFYLLLLLGAILFSTSKGREIRLIRLVFAIILFNKSLFVLYTIISIFFNGAPRTGYSNPMLFFIIYSCTKICWIWLSYRILIFFKRNRNLEVETNMHDNVVSETHISASIGMRLLNFLTDYILIILVYSWVIKLLVLNPGFNNALDRNFPSMVSLEIFFVLIIIFFRALYYVSFEFILGATPSKLLTGTRVIDEEGNNPKFSTVLSRTFVRFVPFEAFSFFSGENGWHDRWSKTYVVNEEGADVKPLF